MYDPCLNSIFINILESRSVGLSLSAAAWLFKGLKSTVWVCNSGPYHGTPDKRRPVKMF